MIRLINNQLFPIQKGIYINKLNNHLNNNNKVIKMNINKWMDWVQDNIVTFLIQKTLISNNKINKLAPNKKYKNKITCKLLNQLEHLVERCQMILCYNSINNNYSKIKNL